ncbi:MAG: phenylalanine--tRNA ligase subunit alpha [Alphaproteobacteria bacterium]|nr:MAG: phenylalanine--tRNA ligase subunit alpha [Alphaproteobacteria bacterium]
MDSTEHLAHIRHASDLTTLEQVRVSLLGKKGVITEALKALSALDGDARKAQGQMLNEQKQLLIAELDARRLELEQHAEHERLARERLDMSLDAAPWRTGKTHPISAVMQEIHDIFALMGFTVRTGPLIEDDDHNFSALNIPDHHPARQMQDTFYIDAASEDTTYVLRTHTSPVQIRTMRSEQPPIRIIAPGSTFRSDSDVTHTPMFHQVEGLVVERGIHMGHLKGCISDFLRLFFGKDDVQIRFRPSFFPFTEPSAEIDIGCTRNKDGLIIGGNHDWLEVMGCGMVHPHVLRACGLDPQQVQGFAFGMGVERLAMLKYNIPDLRTFFDSDQHWLHHYGF